MAIFEEEDETIRQKGLELIEIVPSECTSFEDKDIEYRDIEYFLELYRKNKKPSPIWVREFENTYQVIDGHHRLYTAKYYYYYYYYYYRVRTPPGNAIAERPER